MPRFPTAPAAFATATARCRARPAGRRRMRGAAPPATTGAARSRMRAAAPAPLGRRASRPREPRPSASTQLTHPLTPPSRSRRGRRPLGRRGPFPRATGGATRR
eukprot:scaffold3065_cov141-Isochrysis_galbana.AAC.5